MKNISIFEHQIEKHYAYKNHLEIKIIFRIYDQIFTRLGLTVAYSKTETIAFDVPEEVKANILDFSVNGYVVNNVQTFEYC